MFTVFVGKKMPVNNRLTRRVLDLIFLYGYSLHWDLENNSDPTLYIVLRKYKFQSFFSMEELILPQKEDYVNFNVFLYKNGLPCHDIRTWVLNDTHKTLFHISE